MSTFLFHTKEWVARASEVHAIPFPTQTPSSPALGATCPKLRDSGDRVTAV